MRTGPPYPPGPAPGSNGIGLFVIGVSPIGTIVPFDYRKTIISQYANSPIITALIDDFDQWLDQTQNLNSFYDMMFSVATAVGYGLANWGRVVGVTNVLNVPGTQPYFGFEEALPGSLPLNQGIFYTGGGTTTNFVLSDPAFRILIFAKALANISDGSIKSINQILLRLFPNRGNCYVADNLNMTMTYTFDFSLTPVELAIVEQSGVLPKSTGVAANVSVAA